MRLRAARWARPACRRPFYRRHLAILSAAGGPRHEVPGLLRLVAVGHLRPIIFRTFPLDQVGQAHALVSSRDVFGRVVLEV